jgi:hypothetical protein
MLNFLQTISNKTEKGSKEWQNSNY